MIPTSIRRCLLQRPNYYECSLLPRHLVSGCVSLVRVCGFPGMTIINQKYSFYITVRRVNVHEVNVTWKIIWYCSIAISDYHCTNYLKLIII